MKALIIEDNLEIANAIGVAIQIRWADANVAITPSGERGVEMVEKEEPDIVILDLGLPDISGYDVLKNIRQFSKVPILILTARSMEDDIVKGLEYGADDYMIKPYKKLELLSRVQALLRRYSNFSDDSVPISCGGMYLNPENGTFKYNNNEIRLTNTERHIMRLLMVNWGHVVTYSTLSDGVWGGDFQDAPSSLKVYIRRIREKLESDSSKPKLILTHSGIGYSLAKP